MEDHCAVVDGDVLVVLLQFNGGSNNFPNSKHRYTCAKKCYRQPERISDCLPGTWKPLVVLVKRIVVDVPRESNHTPDEHGQHNKWVDVDTCLVDEADLRSWNTGRRKWAGNAAFQILHCEYPLLQRCEDVKVRRRLESIKVHSMELLTFDIYWMHK